MVGVIVSAAGEIGHEGKCLVRSSGGIFVSEASLPSAGIRQPSEKMIEAAVLHHHQHYVLDLVQFRLRRKQRSGRYGGPGCFQKRFGVHRPSRAELAEGQFSHRMLDPNKNRESVTV